MSTAQLEYWGEAKIRYHAEQALAVNNARGESYRVLDTNGIAILGFVTPTADEVHVFHLKHKNSNAD